MNREDFSDDMSDAKLIDELSRRIKSGRDISIWQKDIRYSSLIQLLSKLHAFPKAPAPAPDFARIKQQILHRITAAVEPVSPQPVGWFKFPNFFKFASGVTASILVVISLGIGTAVAALQSVPGQTIYPLKKIVENVQLKFTADPTAKTNLQIKFANNRLDELVAVIEKNQSGEISTEDTQKILSQTVIDLQKTTAAASNAVVSKDNPKVSTLNKLVDLSNKQTAVLKPLLTAATISSEGEIKTAVRQALETSSVSREQAIKNIENAGLKVEDQPIDIDPDNKIIAHGNLTAISIDSVSVGTAKFLLTKETKYDNIKPAELKVGVTVDILGEVRADKKTYAVNIKLLAASQSETNPKTNLPESETDSTPETQSKTANTDQP